MDAVSPSPEVAAERSERAATAWLGRQLRWEAGLARHRARAAATPLITPGRRPDTAPARRVA